MNRILIFSILFFINLQVSYGFSDKEINKQYGNVHVRVTTGYWYSEIDKALIAAQLAQKLSSRLHYKKPIFIDFHHYYIDNCIPDHFIAYNNGNLNDTWGVNKKKQGIISEKSIVLRQVAPKYDIEATLKLLEYAINNTSLIKREQNIFEYNKNYCQWMIESIDTTLINSLLTKPTSSSVK